MSHRSSQDAVELELIRSLSAGLLPSIIMTIGFAASGGLIVWTIGDRLLLALLGCGLAASGARIAAALRLPRRRGRTDFPINRARQRERDFRLAYLLFAAMLGLFSLRVFLLQAPTIHVLMLCLLMGYAAGVAATIALRPRIAIPSMLMAVVPTIGAAFWRAEPLYLALAMMMSAFLAGGIQNLRVRYAHTVEEVGLRIAFGNIARKDSLTTLPNRVALREWFLERGADSSAGALIAVHYLDLDGFKPVNDRYGHGFGDALLMAVGKRIVSAIRDTDLAARLGGDEFAIVQFGLASPDDAQHLAQRLRAAIARPFHIETHTVSIATSIGYVVTKPGAANLEQLLGWADQALYASKREGGGVTRYPPEDAAALDAA